MKKPEQFYTVERLAAKLAVGQTTIYKLVKTGKIPAVKIGRLIRFDPIMIEVFLRRASMDEKCGTNTACI